MKTMDQQCGLWIPVDIVPTLLCSVFSFEGLSSVIVAAPVSDVFYTRSSLVWHLKQSLPDWAGVILPLGMT